MMPDLDTDPTMMREQQDRDTPQSIGDGASPGRSDSDDESRRDREAATAGWNAEQKSVSASGRDGQASKGSGADPVSMRSTARALSAGLVRKGRSLLGN